MHGACTNPFLSLCACPLGQAVLGRQYPLICGGFSRVSTFCENQASFIDFSQRKNYTDSLNSENPTKAVRIVLGTNVFIAALLGRESGSAWKTVEADLKGADRILAAFIQCCRWTKIYFRWRPNLRDEGDNHIMELAVAGLANSFLTFGTLLKSCRAVACSGGSSS